MTSQLQSSEASFGQLPAIAKASREHWDGNMLIFSAVAMGQTVSGIVDVFDEP